ncbi:MAG: hypothetical protein Q8S21_01265 [Candidatus Paracaedibacteraceae bacterium]|nr:hypothetical protein [Candidatus Paracaedibacteraceae bacterium]
MTTITMIKSDDADKKAESRPVSLKAREIKSAAKVEAITEEESEEEHKNQTKAKSAEKAS